MLLMATTAIGWTADCYAKNKKGIVINYDLNTVTFPYLSQFLGRTSVSPEELYPVVDVYADSQVETVFFNTFCQFSLSPSKVWSTFEDRYQTKMENGVAVDYTKPLESVHHVQTVLGMDIFKIWIDRCREKGITPGLTIRMNDCHESHLSTTFIRSSFFFEAAAKGWTIGPRYGYQHICYNYAVPEVRTKMLDYIKEQLELYDVDALELDFLREMNCFDYLKDPECHKIMNDFMRTVRGIVDEYELKRGHDIELSARLMRDIDQCKTYGFDVRTWYEENLVDALVVGPRWYTCDSDIPLDTWLKAFPKLKIQACIETLMLGTGTTYEQANGLAVQYLSEGSEGIYLCNFFENPLESGPDTRNMKLFRTSGDLKTALKENRVHAVTHQDLAPVGVNAWAPLKGEKTGTFSIEVGTGKIPKGAKTQLVYCLPEDSPQDITVTYNGTKLQAVEPSERDIAYAPATSKMYVIDVSGIKASSQDRK